MYCRIGVKADLATQIDYGSGLPALRKLYAMNPGICRLDKKTVSVQFDRSDWESKFECIVKFTKISVSTSLSKTNAPLSSKSTLGVDHTL